MGSCSASPTSFSPSSQISWYARVFGLRCSESFTDHSYTSWWTWLSTGFTAAITLRFTSPQAAMESMSTAFMPCMVFLQIFLDHAVQLEGLARGETQRAGCHTCARARLSASHCLGVAMPPGRRVRIMKL